MKRNYKLLSVLSLVALLGLTGCGPSDTPSGPNPDQGGDKPGTSTPNIQYKWTGTEDGSPTKVALTLADSFVVKAAKPTHFAPHIVRLNKGKLHYVSSGGDTLLESGDTANLLAYGVPEGFELFASARNAKSGTPVGGIVDATGKVTAPEVTKKTDYIVTLSAKSKERIAGTSTENASHKFLQKDINLTVVPKGAIVKNETIEYPTLTEAERTKITAKLEEYALSHGLTGVRFQTNGGKVLYRDRVYSPVLEHGNYIPTYGWGINQYGKITKDLEKENTVAYKRYLHSLLSPTEDLGTVNYLNSDQKAVSDLYGYIAGSFYGKELNKEFNATVDSNVLARSNPEPLDKDPKTGLAKKWKIKVWVGGDADDPVKGVKKGLNFRTASKSSAQFDNRPITLSDYLTPFKALATGSVGWYRGNEMAESTQGKTRVKGFSKFFADSKNATGFPTDEEFSKAVGVTLDHTDNSITIELEQGFDEDFAKYYLDSLWSNPMCEDFFKSLSKTGSAVEGAKLYGTSPEKLTPADTALSVGPYLLEKYAPGVEVIFKKNETWPFTKDQLGRDLYQVPGFYFKVDSALKNDREEAMKQFENGYTDSVSLSTDAHFEKYGTSPLVKDVKPSGTFGTSFNRMDKALWDTYFGKGGPWYEAMNPDGKLTEGVEVNPIMSNDNFYKALDLGFDRASYAKAEHDLVAFEYFQPGQKVNPATNTFYNDTEEHKQAVKNVYGTAFANPSNTSSFAVTFMQDAILEELDAGHFDLGTVEKPTNFGFTTSVMAGQHYQRIVNYQNTYWQKTFNEAVNSFIDDTGKNTLVENGKPLVSFKVEAKEYTADGAGQGALLGDIWSGVSNTQSVFSISGNSLDSIDYLDILSCNKVAGFELSFAVDTNVPSGIIEHDGRYWSFESLWNACNGGVVTDADGRGSQA